MSPELFGYPILALAQTSAQAPKPQWIETLDAVGLFVDRAGWPIVALTALVLLRKRLANLRWLKLKDYVEMDLGRELEKVERNAPVTDKAAPPSADELARAGQIERLASKVEPEQVRRAAVDLANEYERVRASASPGHARTRRMEVVMSKMRALGRAVVPFRYELRASASPGQRLMAIASYQVAPDYEALGWLVERVREEKPFVGYHAAVALLGAAQDGGAGEHLKELQEAKKLAAALDLAPDTDRDMTIQAFKAQVQSLETQQAAQVKAVTE